MKKLTLEQKVLLLLILIGLLVNIFTNGAKAQTVVKDSAGVFITAKTTEVKKADAPTGKQFKCTDGTLLPVYAGAKGGMYVIRTSKNGKQYKQYLKTN